MNKNNNNKNESVHGNAPKNVVKSVAQFEDDDEKVEEKHSSPISVPMPLAVSVDHLQNHTSYPQNCCSTIDCCDFVLRQQSPPSPYLPTAQSNARLFNFRGERVAGFQISISCRILCLPQVYELFLKQFVGGLHTVYTKLKRLGIRPQICSVEQVRALRNLGAIQSGVNRCKLIETGDFETLYKDCTNTGARPGRPLKRTISDNLHDYSQQQNRHNEAPAPCSSSIAAASFDWRYSTINDAVRRCKPVTGTLLEQPAVDDLSQRYFDDDIYASLNHGDERLLCSFTPNYQQHVLLQYLSDQQQTIPFGFLDQHRKQQQDDMDTTTSSSTSNTTNGTTPQQLMFNIQQAIVVAAAMAAKRAQQQKDEQMDQEKDDSKNKNDRNIIGEEDDSSPYSNAYFALDTMFGTQKMATSSKNTAKIEEEQQQKRSAEKANVSPPFLCSNSPMIALSVGEERSRDSSTFGTNSSSSGRGADRSGSEDGPSMMRNGTDERRAQCESSNRRNKHFKADSRGGGRHNDERRTAAERSSNISSNGNSESPPTESWPSSSGDGYSSSPYNNSESYRPSEQQHHLLNRLNMAVDRVEKVLTDQCQHFYAMVNELKLIRQCQEKDLSRFRAEKRKSELLNQKYIRLRKRQLKTTISAHQPPQQP